jgi:pimeloyl-ACP methyl ester carboxylesterase
LFVLRKLTARRIDRDALLAEERLRHGYVIILPGIEGHSRWNRAIRRGLVNAGVPYAIEIHDWTRGPQWYFWNLRDRRRHRQQAQCIANKIADYREHYPGRPVYRIGHSGGGAMTAFALELLPAGVKATAGVMLVTALSPWFPLQRALGHTERGLWNYSAHGDLFFVGLGTMIFGTCDGRHAPAAGLVGFHRSACDDGKSSECPPLRQMWFHWKMLRDFNIAGHLSCVNPRFVSNWIAPILLEGEPSPARELPLHAVARIASE